MPTPPPLPKNSIGNQKIFSNFRRAAPNLLCRVLINSLENNLILQFRCYSVVTTTVATTSTVLAGSADGNGNVGSADGDGNGDDGDGDGNTNVACVAFRATLFSTLPIECFHEPGCRCRCRRAKMKMGINVF